MNDSTSQYFASADFLSLTPEERAAGRLALQARIALSLAPEEKAEVRRVLQNIVFAEPSPVSSWGWVNLPLRLPAMAFSILLLLGVSSGGLAYAAENAMPGDALYTVKVHVNEALRARLQITPEARAQWALTRLERRMDELRRLEARGIAETEIDVAIGDSIEQTARHVEMEVGALPATAAERAAARTAVNAAIGDDQDSLRRASRINRVLKALKERAEGFDDPAPSVILPSVPVPSAAARVRVDAAVETGPLRVDTNATTTTDAGSSQASSRATSSVRASESEDSSPSREPAIVPDVPDVPDAVDVDSGVDVEGAIEAAL